MKTSIYILFLIGFCSGLISAQGWEKIYELEGENEIPVSAGFTANGDIQFVGHNYVFGNNNFPEQFQYLRVNTDGDTIQSHSELRGDKSIRDVVYTQDGGMLIVGHTDASVEPPYMMKLDANFNEEWINVGGPFRYSYNSATEAATGDIYFSGTRITHYTDGMGNTDSLGFIPWVSKLDGNGNILFTEEYTEFNAGQGYLHSYRTLATNDGGALIAYAKALEQEWYIELIKIDAQGQLEWLQDYDGYDVRDVIEADNGDFLMVGTLWNPNTDFDIFTKRVDSQGNALWTEVLPGPGIDFGKSISATLDGNFYVVGDLRDPTEGMFITLSKVSPQGAILWNQHYTKRGRYSLATKVMTAADGGAYIAGELQDIFFESNFYLIKTDTNGVSLSNEVFGTVYKDLNLDCLPDTTEPGLTNWIVALEGVSNQNYYTNTDSSGAYSISAQQGNHRLRSFPPSPYWEPCEDEYWLTFTSNNFEVENIDIPFQALVDCPYMVVSVGTWALRPCFTSTYYVNYCNHGTIDGEDAYIEITIDSLMTITGATLPYNLTNGVYTFDLDTVAVGECGSFSIDVFLDCEAELDLTYCLESHIFPDSICEPNGNWSGASIEVDAACVNGEVIFDIKNVGTATTTDVIDYFIVEDNVILFQGNIDPLEMGQVETLPSIPGNGSTYRLVAQQEANHPGHSNPGISIERCTNSGPPFSSNQVNIFPHDDADHFIDIECILATGSYDPNDKQGLPLGIGDDHIIEQNQALEYRLRFQNVGTDTAFNVVILDTLSELLNIGTIRPGVSSHPYRFVLSGNGVAEFHFDNIQLPDSTTNELGSQGFVKFRIEQDRDLPLGTLIENSAAIYFDFNDPVITNTTFHTVDEFFDWSVATAEPTLSSTNWQVNPNPFQEETVFVVKDYTGSFPLQLRIYDAIGRLQRVEQITENNFVLEREQLARGLYYYQISEHENTVTSGKLFVQ